MARTRMTSVERYGHRAGESPDVIKRRATGFVTRFITRGGRLVIGFAADHFGEVVLTVAVACGGVYYNSPSLDALAAGLGAMNAVHFLITWTRYRHQAGSIAVAPDELEAWEKSEAPGVHAGVWTGSEHDWRPSADEPGAARPGNARHHGQT